MKKSIRRFFSNVWNIIKLPEMAILPGQLAFFFVLSVVPIITLIGYGSSFLNIPMNFLSNFFQQAFGEDIANLLLPAVSGIKLGFQFFLSLAIGFFIASNGADSIIVTSNTIYGIKNAGYARRRIKAIIMTVLMVLLFLFILLIPVFGAKIIEMINYVNLNVNVTKNLTFAINILNSPIAWLIMFFFIKIIYTMAPDRRIESVYTTYGALFTSILWTIVTMIYSFYVNEIANYSMLYGSLANIIILMLWVYLMAYIFVLGMALNFKKEELAKTGRIEIIKKVENN